METFPVHTYAYHHHLNRVLTMLGWLHEFSLSILIYPKPNPWIGCTSLDLSFLLPSMSSLALPLFLLDHQPVARIKKLFFSMALLLACVGQVQSISNAPDL
eukprot:TRINITY_DN7683_c2_g1_i1.p1 TRINITY_DN7683_c2_g1~~TRINITY_DN7683_c2_g1_i1.p1  ORF type:complete len:101 (-),score=4.50 TRINITY_DN7683_c2_g1_i1:138-440(-)